MKIRIENHAGRHLGTYDVPEIEGAPPEYDPNLLALQLHCVDAGYDSIGEAERKRFVASERVTYSVVEG